ncbi:MAG: hypothetical protein KDB53_15510, partial [Planctomycetes bacterium]|nr:hypothetical protein [Planctomycetota bacterium]
RLVALARCGMPAIEGLALEKLFDDRSMARRDRLTALLRVRPLLRPEKILSQHRVAADSELRALALSQLVQRERPIDLRYLAEAASTEEVVRDFPELALAWMKAGAVAEAARLVYALARTGDPVGIPVYEVALASSHHDLQESAIRGLAATRGDDARVIALLLSAARNPSTTQSATTALEQRERVMILEQKWQPLLRPKPQDGK